MKLLNILIDKIDEIRWNLTFKVEDFIDKIKYRCTKNPHTCKRIICSCLNTEEIIVKPKKKKKTKKK